MEPFRNCVYACNLLELPVVGDRFTWEREGLKERLDWALCNFEWEVANPMAKAFHQLRFKSDHRVIVVGEVSRRSQARSFGGFKYQASWELEDGFVDVVKSAWEGKDWYSGSKAFTESAVRWNENFVGNIPRKKKEIIRRLEGIDKEKQRNPANGLFRLEKSLW